MWIFKEQHMTILDIKEKNKKEGYHFFDKDTMVACKSKIESKVFNNKYFITSEQFGDEPRYYTIREVKENGRIFTINIGKRLTKEMALIKIKQLIEE